MDDNILLLSGDDIVDLFGGREKEILESVKKAYQVHDKGETSLPHSSFVRFPNMEKERIIALPAFLGGDFDVTGIKWIASFPNNLTKGIERASAILVLNSMETGRPTAVMESSVISAKRTAASAALAGYELRNGKPLSDIGLIGCGLINFEIFRFLLALYPDIETAYLFDLSAERAEQFKQKCEELAPHINIKIAAEVDTLFEQCPVISYGTTAVKPHTSDISKCQPGSVILHISLRDLTPEVILAADNVVDDLDHVNRANTSIHLAGQEAGHLDFVRCSIGQFLNGDAPAKTDPNQITIYSPFGLGILDMALAQLAQKLAVEQEDKGVKINSFFPKPWLEREEVRQLD